MLTVAGLALKDLEPHIKKADISLAVNSQLRMSLHNVPGALVATGPAHAEWIRSAQDAVLAEEAGILYSVLSLSTPLTTQSIWRVRRRSCMSGTWVVKGCGLPRSWASQFIMLKMVRNGFLVAGILSHTFFCFRLRYDVGVCKILSPRKFSCSC